MALIYKAACQCGFEKDLVNGGGAFDLVGYGYRAYYCSGCGLVNAKLTDKKVLCPKCGSTEFQEYGRPPISLLYASASNSESTWLMRSTRNLCPACEQMTLVFHVPHGFGD